MIGGEVANWTVPMRMMVRMFRWQRPTVAMDRIRQEQLVKESDLEWTLVKPPRLTNDAASGRMVAGVDLRIGLLSKISRADLAAFLMRECVEPRYVRQAVYVKGEHFIGAEQHAR